ncbi:MAG TPA: hypothetical protein VGP21_00685 [Opitutaceae bacterium]|jgi:hypothetical protein|nr:hypothetical protein [Opitutaceae bacterium]
MNHTRHPMPGRTMPRPPPTPTPTPTPGSPLPFLHEPTGCAGHDLLVLNARPDLAPTKTSPAHGYAGQATAFLQSCFSQEQP